MPNVSMRSLVVAALIAFAPGCMALPESAGDRIDSIEGSSDQPVDAAEEERNLYTPKPSDFTLRVKILEKECFGSAGCNVTFRIKPSYSGEPYGDRSFEITYKVMGPEDGPSISTFELVGDEVSVPSEEFASTPSSSKKIKAKVTEVEES